MTKSNPIPKVADGAPWSDGITEYDSQHHETDNRLLGADAEGIGKNEMTPPHSRHRSR